MFKLRRSSEDASKKKLKKGQTFTSKEAPLSQALVTEVIEVKCSNPELSNYDMVISCKQRLSPAKDIHSPKMRKWGADVKNPFIESTQGTEGTEGAESAKGQIIVTFLKGKIEIMLMLFEA